MCVCVYTRVCVGRRACTCVEVHACVCVCRCLCMPLTEEIRLTIFGSPDLPHFRVDLLCDRDSVYSRENSLENLGTPVKTCLICTGTPVKTCWSSHIHFKSDLLCPWCMCVCGRV